MTRKPNFFIVGAPKCGTTALWEYLRTHPQIFMPQLKEPHFFARDFQPPAKFPATMEQYLELFVSAPEECSAIGEASVSYLYSELGLNLVREFSPGSRIILALRHPAEMAHSLHAQLLYAGDETEREFETAWRLQAQRRAGTAIPRTCRFSPILQYGDMCRLGEQVERALTIFPREQVLFVFLEDLAQSPRTSYLRVLAFLGVEDDGRESFERSNPNTVRRIPALHALLTGRSRALLAARRALRVLLGKRRFVVGRAINRAFTRSEPRTPLSSALRAELSHYFADDIRRLADATERDLSPWLDMATSPPTTIGGHGV